MSPSQEFKNSTKTTPRRDWRLPGNPLYGCLTSFPWRDCSHYESHFNGFVDVMPRQRSQLLCWAIHFNGDQISSATKYLAKSYISLRHLMSSSLLMASTNKHSAQGFIVAQGVSNSGKNAKRDRHNRHFQIECGFILGVPKWKHLIPSQSKVRHNIKCAWWAWCRVCVHSCALSQQWQALKLMSKFFRNFINNTYKICWQLYLQHFAQNLSRSISTNCGYFESFDFS